MNLQQQADECPPERLAQALAAAQTDDARGLAAVEELLADYVRDPRLHFLRGSLLAGLRRYPEARLAMGAAVEIAPAYAIARFQLGLLELTSGEPIAAEATWTSLEGLPEDNPLRLFSDGLRRLIRDDFPGTIEQLQAGIARNTELPQMNRDMQLVIDECRRKIIEGGSGEPTSATQILLQQFGKGTKH